MAHETSLLLIEDETEISESLTRLFDEQLCISLTVCRDGVSGLATALNQSFSAVIIDVGLPGKPGFDVCRELRAAKPKLPIIMLTAHDTELDKVLGLELGADDYVTKPFSGRELVARIRALLRRAESTPAEHAPTESGPTVNIGPFRVDVPSRRVWKNGKDIALTAAEFDILLLFVQSPGRTYSRDELIPLTLGYAAGDYSGAVSAHIARLRGKIEDNPSEPIYLKTVRGIGYRFAARDELLESRKSEE